MALIVFDLDGTLIDSRRDLADSTNEMLATYRAPPLAVDDVARMVGEGAKILVQRALAASGLDPAEPDALDRFRAIYDRRLLIHTRPYDGIQDAIRSASEQSALAILSNKPESPTRRLLAAFDLAQYFPWVIGGDSSFPRKPDPAGLQHLMTQAKATPRTTMYVGDSAIDLETARRAGVHFCAARYGFGSMRGAFDVSPGDLVVDRSSDLEPAIQRFVDAQR